MKQDLHPAYHKVKVFCGCGNIIETGSVRAEIRVEICSACHPLFRGGSGQLIVDTEGRVEKFNKRFGDVVSKKNQK